MAAALPAIGAIIGGAILSKTLAPKVAGTQKIDTSGQERAIRDQTAAQEARAKAEAQRVQAEAQRTSAAAQQAAGAEKTMEERRRRQMRSALTPQASLFDVLGQGQAGSNNQSNTATLG